MMRDHNPNQDGTDGSSKEVQPQGGDPVEDRIFDTLEAIVAQAGDRILDRLFGIVSRECGYRHRARLSRIERASDILDPRDEGEAPPR